MLPEPFVAQYEHDRCSRILSSWSHTFLLKIFPRDCRFPRSVTVEREYCVGAHTTSKEIKKLAIRRYFVIITGF